MSLTRLVVPVMGTVATIVIPAHESARAGGRSAEQACGKAARQLARLDRRFSHYDPGSGIEAWLRGADVGECARSEIAAVLRECRALEEDSDGAFDWHDKDGRVDTAGYVKGYAIDAAGAAMSEHGIEHWLVGVGGDARCRGNADGQDGWHAAVADPQDRRALAAIVALDGQGIATSGQSERGKHLRGVQAHWDSFTVVAATCAQADAWATIGFVLGSEGPDWVSSRGGTWVGVRDGQTVGTARQGATSTF